MDTRWFCTCKKHRETQNKKNHFKYVFHSYIVLNESSLFGMPGLIDDYLMI